MVSACPISNVHVRLLSLIIQITSIIIITSPIYYFSSRCVAISVTLTRETTTTFGTLLLSRKTGIHYCDLCFNSFSFIALF